MADITIRTPDCDDDCERGKRGKRGKRGHDGPPGPPGFGLLKFSGFATAFSQLPGLAISYLADVGVGFGSGTILFVAPSYPVAISRKLRNLAVNVLGLVVPQNGSILVELLQNGALVPGFAITYGPGETGVKTVVAGPTPYAIGVTFDVRVTTSGLGQLEVEGVDMSATVGVE
jgi:hypothetical protein